MVRAGAARCAADRRIRPGDRNASHRASDRRWCQRRLPVSRDGALGKSETRRRRQLSRRRRSRAAQSSRAHGHFHASRAIAIAICSKPSALTKKSATNFSKTPPRASAAKASRTFSRRAFTRTRARSRAARRRSCRMPGSTDSATRRAPRHLARTRAPHARLSEIARRRKIMPLSRTCRQPRAGFRPRSSRFRARHPHSARRSRTRKPRFSAASARKPCLSAR